MSRSGEARAALAIPAWGLPCNEHIRNSLCPRSPNPRLARALIHQINRACPVQEQIDLGLEKLPAISTLRELARAEEACTRCPLYQNATQAVPGEGRRHAHLMLLGEQPGDKEDIAGKPFVGPAGRVLDQALAEAGISRDEVFVTNAVKHFKHEMRGKRRLHKRPN